MQFAGRLRSRDNALHRTPLLPEPVTGYNSIQKPYELHSLGLTGIFHKLISADIIFSLKV